MLQPAHCPFFAALLLTAFASGSGGKPAIPIGTEAAASTSNYIYKREDNAGVHELPPHPAAPISSDAVAISTRVFTHGDAGFVCVRIPATAMLVDGSLLSVAGGRCFTGDSCFPAHTINKDSARNYSAMIARRSTDGGSHWSETIVLAIANHGTNSTKPVCTKSDPAVVADLLHNRVRTAVLETFRKPFHR